MNCTKNGKSTLPHQASRKNFVNGPDYYWCLFKGDIPNVYSDNKHEDETTATNIGIANSGADGKSMNIWSRIKQLFGA